MSESPEARAVVPGSPASSPAPKRPPQAPSSQARSARTRAAYRGLRSGLALRAYLALAGAAVLLAAGVWLTRNGIVDHTFPPYIATADETVITFYSGPYLAGAIVAGALAGLLIVAAITDFWRRRLIGPELSRSHSHLGH